MKFKLTQKLINISLILVILFFCFLFGILTIFKITHYSWILGGILGAVIIIVRHSLSVSVINNFVEEAKITPKRAKRFYWLYIFFNLLLCAAMLMPLGIWPRIFNVFSFLIESSIIIILIVIFNIFNEELSSNFKNKEN